MSQAEILDELTPEQYGRRKEKAAYIQALNTRLFYDLIRQKRIPFTSTFVDIVSNYDLVVHSIASLSLQKVDVSKEPILITFTTLQNITHSVRMAFGVFKPTYGGDTWAVPINTPPQGLGQVNGVTPEIWAFVRTPLLSCLRKSRHGAALKF